MAEVDREIAAVARRQHGVLSIARLRALGLSDRQIRRRVADGRLHTLHRGTFAVGHRALSLRGRWLAAVLAAGPGALLSHRDGAALHDLRAIGDRSLTEVTVDVRGRRSRAGLCIHRGRIHPADRTVIDGIPVTSLSRTLLDLAEVVSPTQLQRAYEQAARLELLDLIAIERLLARSNGRRGVGRLRDLLAYDPARAARTRSELERLFLDLVRDASLPNPMVNAVVAGFEVDAYWPRARLIVELDGYAFHSGRAAFERDREKLTQLRLAGLDVLTFTYRQVTECPAWVAGAIDRILSREG